MSQTTERAGLAEPRAARPHVPLRLWVRTARPFSLSAAVSPLLVGTAAAADAGTFRALPFLAALLAGICLQVGANYWNEYFDHRYQLDTAHSLGASTVIFTGQMRPEQVRTGGIVAFALAALCGLLLLALVGPAILLFGLAALFIAYFYSARPFTFAARGLGDPLVFLAMGLLMTWGAYYVQIPRWSWSAFAASVPVGLLVVAILNMNNVRDYEDDLAVGKQTLVVRLGKPFGRWYHATLLVGAYVATTGVALAGVLPLATLAVWLTFPLAFVILRTALTATDRRAFVTGIKQTSLLHLLFGVVLAAALLAAR